MSVTHPVRTRTHVRRAALSVASASMALLLAACGSQLDPSQVAGAGGTLGAGGVVVGPDGQAKGVEAASFE